MSVMQGQACWLMDESALWLAAQLGMHITVRLPSKFEGFHHLALHNLLEVARGPSGRKCELVMQANRPRML